MKIIYIECDAEEMRANRTILDNITEVISSVTRTMAGFDVDSSQVAEAMSNMKDSEEDEEEEE